jgi:hypothetical protein
MGDGDLRDGDVAGILVLGRHSRSSIVMAGMIYPFPYLAQQDNKYK